MRKQTFLTVIFMALSLTLFSQDKTKLVTLLKGSGELFQEVEAKSYTYGQQLTWDKDYPYKLTYTQDKIDKKGTESTTFEFSLKDIDANTIRVTDQRDLMVVRFFIDNRQKLIRVFEDGEQQKYIHELEMMATDADNGRAIEDFFKEAVGLAKEIPSVCAPASYEERMAFLKENIRNFTINETTYEQVFTVDEDNPVIVNYVRVERDKKTTEEFWKINLADLDPKNVNLDISNTEIFIELETVKNLKYIYYEKDGEQGSYDKNFRIMVNDFDQAKCMMKVLEEVIKESESMNKEAMPEVSSLQAGLDLLKANIGEVVSGEDKTTQDFKASCVNEFTVTDPDGDQEMLKFNLADVEDKSIEIDVKGKEISLEFDTGKGKLVQPFEDGEAQNYTDKVSILANGPENAKLLAYVLPKVVKLCKEKPGFEAKANVGENLKWVQQQLEETKIQELQQSMTIIEDSDCKWQFKTVEEGKKEDKEEIFEFNLIDLDEKELHFSISGDKLSVEVNTSKGEKNIKYYENGEPDDYQDSFLIRMNNVEDARKLMSVLHKSIKLCKEAGE